MQLRALRLCSASLTLAASASAQSFELVSVDSAGVQANQYSQAPWTSADGLRTVFQSGAWNLVGGDTNNSDDIFLRDAVSGLTTRVSVGQSGAESDGFSSTARISGNGRYVVYLSGATNLVAGDTNALVDVFVYDTQSAITTRVNRGIGGAQANGACYAPSISADGRFIAFHSAANNLAPNDTNNVWDVFVHDTQSGSTTRANLSSSGAQATNHAASPSLSADGRFVAFHSNASNLVAGDTNGAWDVFVRDLQAGATWRVSVNSSGVQGNASCADASLSADGRYVAFQSAATNLVAGDTNARDDIFVHDRQTGSTLRASVSSTGQQSSGASKTPRISGDGRRVAFQSQGDNLDPLDFSPEWDVFVHDWVVGATSVASLSSTAGIPGDVSAAPALSFDGRRVVFESYSPNLVPGDLNNNGDVFVRVFAPSPPQSYCTASTSTSGCVASLASVGTPSASAGGGFVLSLAQVDGQRNARIVYGMSGALATPWASGSSSVLCVRPPLQRGPLMFTSGASGVCDGSLSFDFTAFLAGHPSVLGSPLTPGATFFIQTWIQDSGAPKKSQLSSALLVTIAP